MFTDNQSENKDTAFQKYKANTPATANLLIITPLSTYLNDIDDQQTNIRSQHQSTLFRFLEERFQNISEDNEEPKVVKDQIRSIVEEDLEECDFKVGISITKQNGQVARTFTKTIIKSIDFTNETTLIFDKQHEKLKIQENVKYIIQINLETSDGFSKMIWKQNFKIPKNCKKWSVLTITSEKNKDNLTCLNVQLQKIGTFFMKPLSFKLPATLIQEFFDYKFKLLNKSQNLLSSLENILQLKGILLPLSRQNMGSRIIQKLLTKSKSVEIDIVINELKNYFKQMIFDRYGNYVFQKIFKVSNDNQRKLCLKKLQPDMIDILKSKEGTHSMQSLVDNLESQQIFHWFSAFTPNQIIDLSTNKFSMHFIQKLILIPEMNYLFPILLKQFKNLATEKHGIVVLKSVMNAGSLIPEIRYRILEACQNSLHEIAFTEYGHYIVQQMFIYYSYYQLQNILNYMTSYICHFAKNQFSSSLIKKAIDIFGDYASIPFIKSILQNGLAQMMECSSGEFVLHRLMQLNIDADQKQLLMNKMMVLSKEVRCFEKRQKWLKFFKLI